MAISGDLVDLPIPEVLNMIGRRIGTLEILDIPEMNPLTLYLNEGFLRGFYEQGEELGDGLSVRDRLLMVMDSRQGRFVFESCSTEDMRGQLDMPVPRLLGIVASAVDESGAYRDYFANPQVAFKTLAAPNLWLDTNLFVFLEGAKAFLERGVTAQDLSRSLHLDLAQVQTYLFKLRSVGKISPVDPT